MKSKVLCDHIGVIIRGALLILSVILLPLSTYAQQGILFDANQQLSSSFVNQVYIDNDGFIWVATRNGLNKYDGYKFRTIKKEISANMGMASNYVNYIMQDSRGTFYVECTVPYSHSTVTASRTYRSMTCRTVSCHLMLLASLNVIAEKC